MIVCLFLCVCVRARVCVCKRVRKGLCVVFIAVSSTVMVIPGGGRGAVDPLSMADPGPVLLFHGFLKK